MSEFNVLRIDIVWRLSEFAFLCGYFGSRIFYFQGDGFMSKGICKVFVSVLLMLSIITVLTVHAVSNETYNNTPIIVDMFDPNAQKEALPVNSGERLGFRFHATASFDALEFCCPSWGNNIGSMSFSIYEWNKDFDTTLSQPALATVRHINFTDNAVLKIGFDEMLSGEYMVLFHDSEELVGVWSFFSNVSGSYLYLNVVEYDRELQANIHYCETPESNFIECESTIRPPSEPNLQYTRNRNHNHNRNHIRRCSSTCKRPASF